MNFEDFKLKYEYEEVILFPTKVQENPVVSVCVMTYQHEKYITKCIQGIIDQKTDFTFEILIGEDCSTDSTRNICIQFAEKYPEKIRLFLHRRGNNILIGNRPSGRFNLLYNLFSAKGKYVALCEGDDMWIDNFKLQKQVDFLEKNKDCSIVFSGFKIQRSNGNISRTIQYKRLEKLNISQFFSKHYYTRTVTLMFRDQVLSTPFESWMIDSFAADFVLKHRALIIGDFGYINDITSIYSAQTIGSFSKRKTTTQIILKEYKDYLRALHYLDKYKTIPLVVKQKRIRDLRSEVYFKIAKSYKSKFEGLFFLIKNKRRVSIYHLSLFIIRIINS